MNTAKVVQSLSATVAAIQSGNCPDVSSFSTSHAANTESATVITSGGLSEKTPNTLVALSDVFFSDSSRRFEATIAPERLWSHADQREYDSLVEKEALREINRGEFARLEELHVRRRHFLCPPTGDEILFRHEQKRLANEMISLVARYVTVGQNATDSSKGKSS